MRLVLTDDAAIRLSIDERLYSSDVIHKCFYWFGDKYVVDVNLNEHGDAFMVDITLKEGKFGPNDVELLLNRTKENLIDFKTREIIAHETKNIKEILIAKAFAHGDEFDEVPKGDISDPVGFDPTKF